MANRVQTICRHIQRHRPIVNPTAYRQVAPSDGTFRYTLNNDALTPDQRQFYEDNGFIVIKNLVSKDKLDIYRERFEGVCSGQIPSGGMTVMRDVAIAKSEFVPGQRAITKIQEFQYDDTFFTYCCLPEVTRYVECFVGANITAIHTMLINKPPDPGSKSSRHPMHQDLHFIPIRPADRVVCAWTAMERVHRQNGCLVVVPGTHKGALLEHGYPDWEGGVNKLYHGVKGYDASQERFHLEMEPGDTVFFHPILLHGSGMNRTNGFRKAISCHYAASDCHMINVKGTDKQQVEDEILEIANKRFGGTLPKETTLNDIWRLKSRHVKGKDMTIQDSFTRE